MRISDWSSDVCSSDLRHLPPEERRRRRRGGVVPLLRPRGSPSTCLKPYRRCGATTRRVSSSAAPTSPASSSPNAVSRSEEHTSELQSLMRISYAVFCLKKKNTKHHQ